MGTFLIGYGIEVSMIRKFPFFSPGVSEQSRKTGGGARTDPAGAMAPNNSSGGILAGAARVLVKSRSRHCKGRAFSSSVPSSRNEGSDDVPLPIGSPHSKGDTVKDSFLSRNFSHET